MEKAPRSPRTLRETPTDTNKKGRPNIEKTAEKKGAREQGIFDSKR